MKRAHGGNAEGWRAPRRACLKASRQLTRRAGQAT